MLERFRRFFQRADRVIPLSAPSGQASQDTACHWCGRMPHSWDGEGFMIYYGEPTCEDCWNTDEWHDAHKPQYDEVMNA